jgi:hypothetical protein
MSYDVIMDDTEGTSWPGKDQQRILRQLDRMVSAGRVTPQEAERLRVADNADAFQAVMSEIRTRHASAGINEAIADGRMTQAEADDLLHRLRGGEHAPGLRKNHLQQRTSRHRPPDSQ